MVEQRRRVQQYARRKRAGRKTIALPGGLSFKTRQKFKSLSRLRKNIPRREPTRIIDYAHHRAKMEKQMKRYKRIDSILDQLHLRNLSKRQAVHAACEEVVQKVFDIGEQIIDFEARLAEWKAKYNLLAHPEKYEPEKYGHLLKAYGVRGEDTKQALKNQVLFLERCIKTAETEREELYNHPPLGFKEIFGENISNAFWIEVFRKHVFSEENLK